MVMKTLSTFSLVLLLTFSVSAQNATYALDLVNRMDKAIKNHNTLSGTLMKYERWEGEMLESQLQFKCQYSPHKVYLYNLLPTDNKGVEILYDAGQSTTKALVNPNGFPYMNVNLDINGDQLRKKGAGHHPFTIIGFRYFGKLIGYYKNKYSATIHNHLKYHGLVTSNGRSCYKVELKDDNFTYVDYTVKSGQDVIDIAEELNVHVPLK